ncbi:MAG: response regulator transcription factor [Saprospiraceae bacterium]|nr:MAG: response regulator transcription factor [Saprospiraceae bacterium]
MDKIKIIVTDDHRVVASGLQALISGEPDFEVIAIAQNGLETLEILKKQTAGVVLLDINMPKMDGLETTLHIRKSYPATKILILSTHDDGSLVSAALQNGANGYVLKNAPCPELFSAIRTVANGGKVLNFYLTDRMIDSMQEERENPKHALPKITRKEKEVLELIAQQLTTKEIAGRLFISHHTVVTHKKNLFIKLDVKSSVGLVKLAIETGLISK